MLYQYTCYVLLKLMERYSSQKNSQVSHFNKCDTFELVEHLFEASIYFPSHQALYYSSVPPHASPPTNYPHPSHITPHVLTAPPPLLHVLPPHHGSPPLHMLLLLIFLYQY